MKAGEVCINDIFNGARLIEVPFYQRAYVWKTVGKISYGHGICVGYAKALFSWVYHFEKWRDAKYDRRIFQSKDYH